MSTNQRVFGLDAIRVIALHEGVEKPFMRMC